MSSKKQKFNPDDLVSELSESAFFQPPPTSTQTHKTTSTQVDKPEKPQVDKYTTHLRPGTIKRIKRYAFEHDMKDYEVVQMALDAFMVAHEGK